MRDMPYIRPGTRAEWWIITMIVAIVFIPLGVLSGFEFLAMLRSDEFSESRLTLLGYAMYGLPGVVSATCFGTVVLRVSGMPWVWLGCLGGLLIFIAEYGPAIGLLVVIVWMFGNDAVQVAAVGAGMVARVLALAYVVSLVSRHSEPKGGPRRDDRKVEPS